NHYHFVGHSQATSAPLNDFLANLHSTTANLVNELDSTIGRQMWYNFWETRLTYERSYLARLNYVHQNPVRHGLVRVANQYRWCSAAWFERTATSAQVKTIYRLKTDQLRVLDDFELLAPREEAGRVRWVNAVWALSAAALNPNIQTSKAVSSHRTPNIQSGRSHSARPTILTIFVAELLVGGYKSSTVIPPTE